MDTLDKILVKVDGTKLKKEIRKWEQNFLKKIEYEKARTQAIIETAVDGIITINGKGIIQSLNKSAETIFGYRSDELIGHNVNVLMPEPYKSNHDSYIENYFRTGRKISIGKGVEALALKKDGSIFPIYLAVSEVKSSPPEEHIFVGIIQDITRRKEAEERIHNLTYYDQLTKLPNKDLFKTHVKNEIQKVSSRSNKEIFAIMFLGIDKFKNINNRYF